MSEPSPDDQKTKLIADLTELDRLEADNEAGFRAGTAQAVQNRELDRKMLGFLRTVKRDADLPAEAWSSLKSGVRARLDAARFVKTQLVEPLIVYAGTSGANVSTSASATGIISTYLRTPNTGTFPASFAETNSPAALMWPVRQTQALETLKASLRTAYAHRGVLKELATLIETLGVSKAHPGTRSALEHLSAAQLAFEQPPGGQTSPTGVLVELREGVHALLERLKHRLIGQDPGRAVSERITSIGKRAGYLVFSAEHFERLGKDLEELVRGLTDAKSQTMQRDEIADVFNRVLYDLKVLLTSIDPGRLRPQK